MFDFIEREIRTLKARMTASVARAVIGAVNDGMKVQRLQLSILADEDTDPNVEHFQPYGLSFMPPVGAEAIALGVGGSRDHTIAICAQLPGERPVGSEPGTGGLYTAKKWRLFIEADGTVMLGTEAGVLVGPDGVVHLGARSGAEPVSLADKTDARITALQEKVDALIQSHIAHVHPTGAPGAPTTAITPPPVIPVLGGLESVAATRVHAT